MILLPTLFLTCSLPWASASPHPPDFAQLYSSSAGPSAFQPSFPQMWCSLGLWSRPFSLLIQHILPGQPSSPTVSFTSYKNQHGLKTPSSSVISSARKLGIILNASLSLSSPIQSLVMVNVHVFPILNSSASLHADCHCATPGHHPLLSGLLQ